MNERNRLLYSGFLSSSDVFPKRTALKIKSKVYSYQELKKEAFSIAGILNKYSSKDDPLLTAIFASRSFLSYTGILGTLISGRGYIPINYKFPVERIINIIEQTSCNSFIVDNLSEGKFFRVLEYIKKPSIILMNDRENTKDLMKTWPKHIFISKSEFAAYDDFENNFMSSASIAYIMFTSGSTGHPKGVKISLQHSRFFINSILKRYGFSNNDRFSQLADITWDASVNDLFVAWSCGACVCCPSDKEVLFAPESYLLKSEITVAHLVPSTVIKNDE